MEKLKARFSKQEHEKIAAAIIAESTLSFLGLAVRFASFWLDSAMILQGVQFSLHAYYLIGEVPHDRTYFRVNNADTIGILLFIIVGAVMSWRKRERKAREEAARAAAKDSA